MKTLEMLQQANSNETIPGLPVLGGMHDAGGAVNKRYREGNDHMTTTLKNVIETEQKCQYCQTIKKNA